MLENTTFCSLFTNRLRPFRDFIHHTVTSINHPSFLIGDMRYSAKQFSLLVFRACNDFCTVFSRTVLNTFTLQTCFCISARLHLIVSPHFSVQFIRSSRLFSRTPKELFLLLFSVGEHSVHPQYLCYLNVCNTEIMICGWKDCLCCFFWTSSNMNADVNVFTLLYIIKHYYNV